MRERIVEHIQANGPMPFDEYMEWCLYDPADGFFASGPVRSGRKGDFVTSPEISWAFGYCVGEWADKNTPSNGAALVEVGAGSGALLGEMADLWTADGNPVYAVEKSIEARNRIAVALGDVRVLASIEEIPEGIDAVIVANEVLDNMPAALARRTAEGWGEIAVGADGDELVLVDVPARTDVAAWCDDTFGETPVGATVSVQLAVSEWIAQIFNHFGAVTMCLVDYGAKSDELINRNPASIIRTYRKHQGGIDWLQHPSEVDITVDVNINALLKAIARQGRRARLLEQRDFVLEHGLDEIIADARDGEQLAASKGAIMHQLENRSERLDMEALIDPKGFGAFSVILVE
jgi:SAM-dependent MidA family methyltransferase